MKKTRYIPEGYVEFKPANFDEYPKDMFACWVSKELPIAMFFIGKQSSYTWYNKFRDNTQMKEKILKTISNLMSHEESKAKRKEERKASHSLKVGDILYSSWGYDQTNIDFYQVIRVVSDRTVEIREIGSKVLDSGYGQDTVVGVKDAFLSPRGEYDDTGKPMIKRVSSDNTIKISSFEYAWPWDGTARSETSLGYGH